MARDRIHSRVLIPLSLALFLSGCPSSCQQRRETRQAGGERIEIKVDKAEIENQKETKTRQGSKVTKRLRPNGTPWEVVTENDTETTKLEIDRELLEKAEGASLKWNNSSDVVTSRPWWYWPLIWLVILALLAATALYLARRFFGGR